MARIRTIKPNFFKHEHLSALDAETQLLAAGLLCYADDDGYFNANPKLIQGEIFPVRELTKKVSDMLTQLAKIGYIRLGKGQDGRHYGHVINFLDHQVINRPKPSEIKDLPISWTDHGIVSDSSHPEWNGMEVERKGKEGSSAQNAVGESLHAQVREFIKKCITHETKLSPAPWDSKDAKFLKRVLDANPSWNFETYKKLIQNKFRSDEPRGEPAWKWLPQLSKYAEGPLDRFGKLEQENGQNRQNGTGSVSRQTARNDSNREKLARSILGVDASGDAAHGGVAGEVRLDGKRDRVLEAPSIGLPGKPH